MGIKQGVTAGGLLLVLGLAGCTDDGTNQGGNDGSSGKDAALEYSQCMRENGVANFPDPKVDDNGTLSYDVPEDIPESVLNPAEKKCADLHPFGDGPSSAEIEQLRQHAKCMRENGIPDYPDPGQDGQLMLDFEAHGLSGPDDPKLKAAEETCRDHQPPPPSGTQRGNG